MKLRQIRPVTVLALLVFAAAAQAQYVWLDERGTRQYSDLPPPASVPAERILKQPGATAVVPPVPVAAAAAAKEGKTPAGPLTLAEREAEFRKRRAEQAEKEKKAAEEARVAEENKKRCERLRDYQRALESNDVLTRRDKNGERQLVSNDERARELAEAKRNLAACK
jgi:hypothetical protein